MLRVRNTSRTRPEPFVHVEAPGLGSGDAGGILAAMLQHLQAVIEQLIDWGSLQLPDYSAHRFTTRP